MRRCDGWPKLRLSNGTRVGDAAGKEIIDQLVETLLAAEMKRATAAAAQRGPGAEANLTLSFEGDEPVVAFFFVSAANVTTEGLANHEFLPMVLISFDPE